MPLQVAPITICSLTRLNCARHLEVCIQSVIHVGLLLLVVAVISALRHIKDWVQLFCTCCLNYPWGGRYCTTNRNPVVSMRDLGMQLYIGTEGPAKACTGPYNNAQSCPYFFLLKRDVRHMSVTLDVVLPSASSEFQSVHSGVRCSYLRVSHIMAA